jgi:prokaryotic ubiquitin-like protein Pup
MTMPEQERKQKRTDGAPPAEGGQNTGAAAKGKKLKDEMDRLVDEIDDVLEENAEEFVKSYVQRGGQ